MTDEKILEKAILKAERNSQKNLLGYPLIKDPYTCGLYDIIFSHEFAIAFWGRKPFVFKAKSKSPFMVSSPGIIKLKADGSWEVDMEEWQYHLQQMVLEEKPLKYLEKFL